MSLLRKSLNLARAEIKKIDKFTAQDGTGLQEWLDEFCVKLENNHKALYNHVEAGGMRTKSWDIKEATAKDVADGNANAVGDLMIKHKTTGTEWLIESTV